MAHQIKGEISVNGNAVSFDLEVDVELFSSMMTSLIPELCAPAQSPEDPQSTSIQQQSTTGTSDNISTITSREEKEAVVLRYASKIGINVRGRILNRMLRDDFTFSEENIVYFLETTKTKWQIEDKLLSLGINLSALSGQNIWTRARLVYRGLTTFQEAIERLVKETTGQEIIKQDQHSTESVVSGSDKSEIQQPSEPSSKQPDQSGPNKASELEPTGSDEDHGWMKQFNFNDGGTLPDTGMSQAFQHAVVPEDLPGNKKSKSSAGEALANEQPVPANESDVPPTDDKSVAAPEDKAPDKPNDDIERAISGLEGLTKRDVERLDRAGFKTVKDLRSMNTSALWKVVGPGGAKAAKRIREVADKVGIVIG